MSNKKVNKNLNNKIIELSILNEVEYTYKVINCINDRIKFYATLLNHLEENKPLFFQKKKIIDYNQKYKEYDTKIDALYTELGEEVSLLEELSTSI